MTRLDCNVTNCMHNADNCCCRREITVEGIKADRGCDTCCGNFDEKKEWSFKNLFKPPESRLQVRCEAVKCVYNQECFCSAEHVGISGMNAKRTGETECSTFKAR